MFPKNPLSMGKPRPGNEQACSQILPSQQKMYKGNSILFAYTASRHLKTVLLCSVPFCDPSFITKRVFVTIQSNLTFCSYMNAVLKMKGITGEAWHSLLAVLTPRKTCIITKTVSCRYSTVNHEFKGSQN